MIIETLALSAAIASIDPFVQPGFDRPNSGARQLATPAIQIYSHADSVHRPGFNGRLWVGGMCIGGVDAPVAPDQGQPGPLAYGAHPGGSEQAYVRVGSLIVAINPWEERRAHGDQRLEAARQEWLAERGYTGGVRTFMNDANFIAEHSHADQHADAGAPADAPVDVRAIQPRAIIELAPDAPRHRSRMRVEAPRAIRVLPAAESRVASK